MGSGSLASTSTTPLATQPAPALNPGTKPAHPMVISSGNGLPAVTGAMQQLQAGAACVDAVVAGVTLVEDDPNDHTVGYGGIPNEDGVVQLDASVMDGPMHKAGAVAALERIRNPAQVALKVLRTTDHVLLVGEGALKFAKAHGFKEEDLLTDEAREIWMRWRANRDPDDDWLDRAHQLGAKPVTDPITWGTIHCAAVDANGDLGACTTTSGLSFKLAGRVGDSPIIGAGNYVQNEIGAAGATGRGEAVMQACGAFHVVQRMAAGDDPTQACLHVLRWIADHTKRKDLRNDRGQPNFSVTLYALRKDGAFGSATMREEKRFAVADAQGTRLEECAVLFR